MFKRSLFALSLGVGAVLAVSHREEIKGQLAAVAEDWSKRSRPQAPSLPTVPAVAPQVATAAQDGALSASLNHQSTMTRDLRPKAEATKSKVRKKANVTTGKQTSRARTEQRPAKKEAVRPSFVAAAAPAKIPANRWMEGLGQGGQLHMNATRPDQGACSTGHEASCREPDAKELVSIVGVVVHTQNLKPVNDHLVAGQLNRGSHREGTPAVYVD